MFWGREEQALFRPQRVRPGIDFKKYDEIFVDKSGGDGQEAAPIASFKEACERFGLPELLIQNIARCKYKLPTPAQKHGIPAALGGDDVMMCAQTGSGKTVAFLVPLISTVLQVGTRPPEIGPARPAAVVLAPTRELCQQIAVDARRLCFRSPIRIVCIHGGSDAVPQLQDLAAGCDLAICTPGRLHDFLERGVITVLDVRYLVLDEADRMLDMGLEGQIRSIIDDHGMPSPEDEYGRQTMMFSATLPKEMQLLAQDYMDSEYMWVSIGRVGSTASGVEERFADTSRLLEHEKFDVMLERLREVTGRDDRPAKTLIFANERARVDDLASRLGRAQIPAIPIHAGISQSGREKALSDLNSDRVSVLVATDLAARGLDLPGVDHVINYELPKTTDDYVHRVGRTARIGNRGVATSFVGFQEPALMGIVRRMRQALEEDPSASEVPAWVNQYLDARSGYTETGEDEGRFRDRSARPNFSYRQRAWTPSRSPSFAARSGS